MQEDGPVPVRQQFRDLLIYQDQFVYLDDEAVFSNAWAGKLYLNHDLPNARAFAGGADFGFMVSDGSNLTFIKNSEKLDDFKIIY